MEIPFLLLLSFMLTIGQLQAADQPASSSSKPHSPPPTDLSSSCGTRFRNNVLPFCAYRPFSDEATPLTVLRKDGNNDAAVIQTSFGTLEISHLPEESGEVYNTLGFTGTPMDYGTLFSSNHVELDNKGFIRVWTIPACSLPERSTPVILFLNSERQNQITDMLIATQLCSQSKVTIIYVFRRQKDLNSSELPEHEHTDLAQVYQWILRSQKSMDRPLFIYGRSFAAHTALSYAEAYNVSALLLEMPIYPIVESALNGTEGYNKYIESLAIVERDDILDEITLNRPPLFFAASFQKGEDIKYVILETYETSAWALSSSTSKHGTEARDDSLIKNRSKYLENMTRFIRRIAPNENQRHSTWWRSVVSFFCRTRN